MIRAEYRVGKTERKLGTAEFFPRSYCRKQEVKINLIATLQKKHIP
jgi:hypothetical protein